MQRLFTPVGLYAGSLTKKGKEVSIKTKNGQGNFGQGNQHIMQLLTARPGQAGELGREEPDEVQQGQVQGPAPGEEQPDAPVQAQGGPAGEQLCGEGPGRPGG